MKWKYIYLAFSVLLLLPLKGISQPADLIPLLEGKTTFDEVSSTIDQYLETAPETYEKQKFAKHYARWAYYQSMHLGPDGEFVNTNKRTFEAVRQLPPPSPERSANGDWTFVGPQTTYLNNPDADFLGLARADRIAFHPTNSLTIYLGTPSGGLWRTVNGGSTWTPLSNFIPSLGISGIVVSHANANTIYVLTGDGDTYYDETFLFVLGYVRLSVGVLVSYDGGNTWQQTGPLATGDYAGFRLVQHPTNANILLAATSEGLYKTVDGGANWTQVLTGRIYDVEFKPGTPSRVYASGVASFFYSTDTGDNWNSTSTFSHPLCANGRVEIAVAPSSSAKVYLFSGPKGAGNTFCGFYLSTDSGLNFTRTTNTPNILGDENGNYDQSRYDMTLTVKPTNSNVVVTGGLVIYKTTDGGTNFTNMTTYSEAGGNYIHPDVHCVAYNPVDNALYAATDGGFYKSTDDGVTWAIIHSGFGATQFYHIDDYDANQYTILGGCQDNGIKFRSGNTTNFSHVYCCDGGDATIDYSNQYRGFASINDQIRYFSHFTTTTPTFVAGFQYAFFPKHELHISNPDILYYSFSSIYKYTVSTSTNTTLSNTARGFWALKTCPSNASRIYAAGGTTAWATTGSLYVSSDGGSNWSTISGNTGFPSSYPRITDIGVYPSNSSQVYVTFGGYTDGVKVCYSSNTGTAWTNISYDLPNVAVWSVEVDGSNNAYVGTDIGVFYKAAGATSWEPFYNNLPNSPVSDLAINTGADQIMAATFGRGIWKTSLRDPCPATFAVTSNVSGHYFKSASASITMNSDVVGGEGTYAVLRTPGYVDLLPGFQANGDPGNRFLAYIGPCDAGLPPDFSGQFPIFPEEMIGYRVNFTRSFGTLEIPLTDSRKKAVVLRLFQDGDVRILLADNYGKFIRDIAAFNGGKDTYTYNLDASGLAAGTYYLYLVVNGQADHLQELEIP